MVCEVVRTAQEKRSRSRTWCLLTINGQFRWFFKCFYFYYNRCYCSYCDCSYCHCWSLLMTNSCGKTTVNWLRLHPVGLISVTIPIFRTLSTQGQMFSWYQFDIPILMRTYLLFSIIQILNKRTSRVQKTDWDVSTTATDKFILLCPALLIIHHEYKDRDVFLWIPLKPLFILHIQYSCRKKIA